MKAIRVHKFGEPDVMRLEEISVPLAGPGQVVVEVRAAGVNPVDTYIRAGQFTDQPALPYTPGLDAAGVIAEVGKGVTGWAVGDRVYTGFNISGSYADFVLCEQSQVHCLSDNVSFQQGAAIGVPYGVAYYALFNKALAKPGESVLIHGATGGVGIAAVQMARAAGLRVIGTGGTEKGLLLASEQGAHHVVNHRAPDHFEQIMKLTNGHGVDVILEMLANVNLGKDLKILSHGGRVAVIGSRGAVEIDPRDAMSRDATILGVVFFNCPEPGLSSVHAALGAGLENRTLRPVIGKEMPLADAAKAHVEILESASHGKIVLIP